MNRFLTLTVASLLLAIPGSAFAAVIYSQTPSSTVTGTESDSNGTYQTAEDFTLTGAATLRSVTWRGFYYPNNSQVFPLSFNLILYTDSAGLPNPSTIVSSPVTAQATDTGLFAVGGNYKVYEFTADVTPVALAAATKYWFSPYANTANDIDDNWYWTTSFAGGMAAQRPNSSNSFALSSGGPYYFILNDTVVPEPASLALLGIGGLALVRWRRA